MFRRDPFLPSLAGVPSPARRFARGASLLVALGLASGCGAPERQTWTNTFTGDGEDHFVLDDDLTCLDDARWTNVGGTRVANLLGHHDEAVALAESGEAGAYPVGTLLQLFPEEVSVKRGAGFSPETNDWEFLKLHVGSGRTVITERGTTEIGNPAGTCMSCHAAAKNHDLACFTNESCEPLPFFIDTHVEPKTEDPRCH